MIGEVLWSFVLGLWWGGLAGFVVGIVLVGWVGRPRK